MDQHEFQLILVYALGLAQGWLVGRHARLRRTALWALSWGCYFLGDAFSRPCRWFGNSWANRVCVRLCYSLYHVLMGWSSDLQECGGAGPWRPADEEARDA